MADYRISAILSLKDQLTSKLKSATNAIKNITSATANVERGIGGVSKGISSVSKGIGDFRDQNLKLRLGVEGLERVERLKGAIEAARAGKAINIRANDEATSRLQRIKSELQSLVAKPWQAVVNIKDNAKAALSNAKGRISDGLSNGAAMAGATFMGLGAVGGMTFGAANAIRSQMDFEKSMSSVKAVLSGTYKDGALESVMTSLTAKAEEMGATTKFTAKEAAEGLYYMGMAGWKAEQMTAGLPPILNLAAAGNTDLATTSDIVTDSMTGFGLKAGQYVKNAKGELVESTAHYADLMATLVTNANTDIPMLGETLKYAAPLVGAMYSNQDENARMNGAQDMMLVAGLMANAGIKSSQAGTSARALFSRLGSQNRNADFARQFLNVDFKDEQTGEVRRMKDFFGDLRTKFQKGMDVEDLLDFAEDLEGTKLHADTRRKLESSLKSAQEHGGKMTGSEMLKMAAMLSGQEAMSGLLAVMTASEEDWNKLSDALDNAEGAADRMSKIQLDNLAGSFTLLGSSWDAFQRNLVKGDASKGLRAFVDSVKDTLDKANELFKDGIDVSDFGTIIIDVIAKLKAKFLELDGIGSILAGGALIMGMKKILTMALNVKDTLSAWSKVRSAGDVGGMIRGGKGAGAGGLSSVGAMSVRAGSVSIRAAVVNVSGAVRGLNGGNGGVGGAGGRGGAVSVNQQRVNDYYNRRQQILNPTTTVPPVIPPSATPPPAPASATGKVASVLKGGLKAGGGAGALAAVFGVMDVMAARSQGEYALQTAQSELEYERGQLKILREQEADVTQLNDQVAKIRALEAKVSQTQDLNVANERRAIGGAGGMIAGTMAGAALGSIVPVVGTAIGGLIGGIVGGMLGQSAGEAAADKYTELDNARREGIAESRGAGGTGEASWSDFRRIQDEGYTSVEALRNNAKHISARQSAEYDGLKAAAEARQEEYEQAEARRAEYERFDAAERGRRDWQSFKQLEDETYEARRSAKSKREESAEAIRDQFDAEKTRQEVFGKYDKIETLASGNKSITPGMRVGRQEAAGYTSLNGVETGTTGLEGFGKIKTAEQVKAEVAERKRVTDLLDEFDANGERRKAVEAAREGEITPTDPYAGLKQSGVGKYSAEQTPIKMLKDGSLVDVKQAGKPPAAKEPVSPYDGLSKYGGQKTGLENYGVKQGETSDSKPFSFHDFLGDLLFNKAAASPVSEAAETGVGEVNASENISSTLDGLESVKSKVGEVNETLSTGLESANKTFDSVTEKATFGLESAKAATAETFDGIGEKIRAGLESSNTTFDSFKNAASSKFDELSSTASEKFSGIGETFSSVRDSVTSGITEIGTSISDGFSGAFESLSASVSTGLETFATSFSAGFETLLTSATTFAESLSTTLSAGFEALTAGVTSTFEAISMTASVGLETLQMTAATMLEGVSMSFSATFETILASTSATFESLSATISASVSAASAVITSTFSSASATVQGIWGAIPGFFSGVFGSLGGIAAGAGSAIASGINSGIGMIMGAWESLSGWLSAKISSLASMAASAAASIGIGSNASGTSSWRGGFTTVNEHGGELIILPSGKTITPYETMQDVIAHNYGGTANFHGGFSTVNEHGGELIILPSGKTIYPRVTTNSVLGDVAHNYSGTSFFEGGWSEVNGTGSELMFLPRGTRIIPHATTVGILRKQIREKMKEHSHEKILQQSARQSAAAPAMALELGRWQAGENEAVSVAEENRRVREERGMGERRIALDKNAAPAITRYLRNKELFNSTTSNLLGHRAINAAHNYSGTSYFGESYQRDSLGNIVGLEIPEYNRVTAEDSLTVKRAKQEAQRRAYLKRENATESVREESERSARNSVSSRYATKENALAEKISTVSLGNLLNPEYNRVTGDIAHNYGGTSNFEGGFTIVNEHGGEIIQLPNGETIYPKATVEREIKTDRLGNIRGLDAPSYNRITGGDSLTVRNAKYQAQLKQWRNNREDEHTLAAVNEAAGTGFGRAEFGTARDSGTGKIAGGEGRIQPAIPAETTAVSQNKYSNLRRMSRDLQQSHWENTIKNAVTNRNGAGTGGQDFRRTVHDANTPVESGILPATAQIEARNAGNAVVPGKNVHVGVDIERPAGRVAGKNFFEKGVEATNDFFFRLLHPRKYAEKKAAAQNPGSTGVKTATVKVDAPDKKSGFQRSFDSVNDFFFKIFHPRKYAAKKAKQREDIFQQTVNERAATFNAASETNVADAVNSTTKQVAGVDWGGVLKLILGKKLNRSSVNLGASEYAEKRRAAQANWVANLQQLNPDAKVRTFGMADALLNPLGIRIQSAGLPTSGSKTGGQDVFGSINDYFFKIFHPRKYAAKQNPFNKDVKTATVSVDEANRRSAIQRTFDSINDFFFKIFHPRKYALKKRGSDKLGNLNGLNGLPDNIITESDSLAVQKAKREAQIREFNRQHTGRRKNFFEKTWEAIVGFFGGAKKKGAELNPIVNAALNPVGEVSGSAVADAKKSADIFQNELPSQAHSLDPNRKTQAEILYEELSAQYAELERLGMVSKSASATNTVTASQTRDLSSAGMTVERLQELRRENLRETGYNAAANAENLETYRTRIEANARDSQMRQDAVRNTGVTELEKVANVSANSELERKTDAKQISTRNDFRAKLEKNRRDSEALAKIRRESVKKKLAERNVTVSEESMQVVRDLNEAAVARSSHSSTRLADIHAENLREVQRLRETGGLDAGNFFNVAGQGELPVPKLTVPTSEGGTTNTTTNSTSNNSSVNMNFGDVNINNGADFEEFMHRLKTLFTQSAVNFAGA